MKKDVSELLSQEEKELLTQQIKEEVRTIKTELEDRKNFRKKDVKSSFIKEEKDGVYKR